jgi:DNA-binding GntR family transcriptional regulator
MTKSTETVLHRGGGQPKSLSDQIYQILSEQIISGEIQYGDRLNMKELAVKLNVSIMPIRDALKRLEMENVVVIKPRSTCHVRVPTKQMTLDAVEARRMLEVFAVREALPRIEDHDLEELRSIVHTMTALVRPYTDGRPRAVIEQYITLDHRFHTALCSLPRNEYLSRFYRETSMHLNMSFRYGIGVCHGLEATFHDHCEILDGLARRSVRAVEVLDSHLKQSRTNIMREPTFMMLED